MQSNGFFKNDRGPFHPSSSSRIEIFQRDFKSNFGGIAGSSDESWCISEEVKKRQVLPGGGGASCRHFDLFVPSGGGDLEYVIQGLEVANEP